MDILSFTVQWIKNSVAKNPHLVAVRQFLRVLDEEVDPGVGVNVDRHAESVATVGQHSDDLDGDGLTGL